MALHICDLLIVNPLLFLFKPWLTLYQWQSKQKIVSTCTSREVKRENQEKVLQDENWSQAVKEAMADYSWLFVPSLYGIILYTMLRRNYICLWNFGYFSLIRRAPTHSFHRGPVLGNLLSHSFDHVSQSLNCTSTHRRVDERDNISKTTKSGFSMPKFTDEA